MRTLVYYVGTSLDGYIADPENEVDFFPLSDAMAAWINELILERYPVVAGSGVPVFGGAFHPTAFVPTREETFDNGASVTWLARR